MVRNASQPLVDRSLRAALTTLAAFRTNFAWQARAYPKFLGRRVIYVRTMDIRYWKRGSDWKTPRNAFILEGDWDLGPKQEATGHNSLITRTVRHLFVEGVPVEQCDQYLQMKECLEGGRRCVMHGCRTLADVREYFDRLQQAFQDIRDHGYKSQAELGGDPADEMGASIARDGEPIKTSRGNHRLVIARLLGIEFLPVRVQEVHWLWAQEWFKACGGDICAAIDQGLKALDVRAERPIPGARTPEPFPHPAQVQT